MKGKMSDSHPAVAPGLAATVIPLREAPGGFQVFLVERGPTAPFMADTHVFPGGRLDRADAHVPISHHEPNLARMRHPSASALMVAAARELLEEAGIPLFTGPIPASARRELLADRGALARICREYGARIRADSLFPWSRWVTPACRPIRFDTWFFVARVPPSVLASHDGKENTSSAWWHPARAIAAFQARRVLLSPPTFHHLQELRRYDRLDQVLAAASSRSLEPICPHMSLLSSDTILFSLPGHPRHSASRPDPGTISFTWNVGPWLHMKFPRKLLAEVKAHAGREDSLGISRNSAGEG